MLGSLKCFHAVSKPGSCLLHDLSDNAYLHGHHLPPIIELLLGIIVIVIITRINALLPLALRIDLFQP